MFLIQQYIFNSHAVGRVTGAVVARIRLNAIRMDRLHGRKVVVKCRNLFGRYITPMANLFFRATHAPNFFWINTARWQRWEVKCFRMLNPGYHAVRMGRHAICEEKLPGQTLWHHVQRGTLTIPMLQAAAKEFARAHQFWSEVHNDLWSHGDGAMCNVLYDAQEGRARLIDFELMHHKTLPAVVRHADDLCAFLLDLVGIVPSRRWLPYALCFLQAYNNPVVMVELQRQLTDPPGLGRFWRGIRTSFGDRKKFNRRLNLLQQALDQGALAPVVLPVDGARSGSP